MFNEKSILWYGAFGGATVALSALILDEWGLIPSYLVLYDVVGLAPFLGLIARIGMFVALGAFWVHVFSEVKPLKAIQLGIAAPAALAAAIGIEVSSSANDVPIDEANQSTLNYYWAFAAGLQAKKLSPRVSENAITQTEFRTEPTASVDDNFYRIVSDLIDQFSGPNRRSASDAIVNAYNEGNMEKQRIIVARLIGNSMSEGRYAYRVNLYILRTLGLLSEWSCKETECKDFRMMNSLTSDETYTSWYNRASSKLDASQ